MAERIDRISQPGPLTTRPVTRERILELTPSAPANPPVFRAWVANRLLGENLRAALSPTFERTQKLEPTPFVRYRKEARETLKTIKARPEKETASAETRPVASLQLADLAPLKLKLKLNPKLDAQRAVGRFQAEVDSLVPLNLTAPKLMEPLSIRKSDADNKPSELKVSASALPVLESSKARPSFDLKPVMPEVQARLDRILARPLDLKPFEIRPLLPEIRTNLARFDLKPVLPELPARLDRIPARPLDLKPFEIRPLLPEIRTNLARFDLKPVLPEVPARLDRTTVRPLDLKPFEIRPLLPEVRTNLARFDLKPVLPEVLAPQTRPTTVPTRLDVPLVRPQNAQREIHSSNEARLVQRPALGSFTRQPLPLPQTPVVTATNASTQPASLRLASSSGGVLKQVASSNESRAQVSSLTSTPGPARPATVTPATPPPGSNGSRLIFSSPTNVRGDLTVAGSAGTATEALAFKAGPVPAAKVPASPDPLKLEKHDVEDVSARPVAAEQKLRTSSSEPLRSQAARATRQALEGKEEPDSSDERPAFAIAPIQSLQREEKLEQNAPEKEEKEKGRSILSGGMGGQAPIAPLQTFHQDERYAGASPTYAPPQREGGTDRKPPESPQPRLPAEEAAARAREAAPSAQLTAGQALQQNFSQKTQDQEICLERNLEETRDGEGVESKKESSGGASKSGRGTEAEQARRQQAQRQQSAPGKSSPGSRPRYLTRPQDPDEPEEISTSEDAGLNCCGKCGYLLGGSADLACPVCSSEQPDLALRIFTQVRQQGAHWITCADTLAVTEDARHSLADMATSTVHLHFVPKIPKYSQVLKLNQK